MGNSNFRLKMILTRTISIIVSSGLLFWTLSVSGIGKEPESAEAIITMSDGSLISGTITIIGANPITIAPLRDNRQKQFFFRDIIAIENKPESAEMKKPWVYKESGSIEKVYYDEKEYPFMNFITKITLVDGAEVTGHIVSAAFNVKDKTGKYKIFLQRQTKGEKGEKIEDVVYPVILRFPGNTAKDATPLKGVVEGFGKLVSASAMDMERETVLNAKISGGGTFDFGNVLPGSYDIYILTDSCALAGFSSTVPSNMKNRPLQEGDLEAIRKIFPLTDDFFKDRWVLRLAGSRDYAKTLVYKRRAEFYDSASIVPGGYIWHLEIMCWHLPENEWQLDKRHIVIRCKQKGTEKIRKLFNLQLLSAVKPGDELKINPETVGENREFIRDLD
jgi:hypothetical protein